MSQANEGDGKNSLIGEYLLFVARSPENLQESMLVQSLKIALAQNPKLIQPYPMLSHLVHILSLEDPIK